MPTKPSRFVRQLPLVLSLVCLSIGTVLGQQPPPPVPSPDATGVAPATPAQGRGGRGGRGAPRVVFIPDAPTLNYTLVTNPLPLPEGLTYGVVASVAVSSTGQVFVYHRSPTPLVEFTAAGRFVRGHRENTDTRAHSIRIDTANNMWLIDSGDHTVTKLGPRGDVLLTLGTKGTSGSGDEAARTPLFNIPSDVAIAPNGDIFVAQGEAGGPDPRVIRFDRTGRFLNTWSLAYTEGIRSNPHAIEVDRNGLIYVADREVMRIRVFRADGSHVRDIQLKNLACGLFVDRDQRLWVSTGTDGMVLQVAWDGTVLGKMGTAGRGAGQIAEGHMLSVAPSGDVYVADSVNRVVHKFVPNQQ